MRVVVLSGFDFRVRVFDCVRLINIRNYLIFVHWQHKCKCNIFNTFQVTNCFLRLNAKQQ